ncbi:MAG: glutathione S-transferase family protein [Alphaproteobacteria bacterium]|nr:glutathione S-transferase family protein [Alphaproteobacteria bacterium]
MAKEYVVYGARGSGSVPVEATLRLLGLPHRVLDVPILRDDAAEEAKFARVNPMRQVPALVTPAGELITESAAILIWLADAHPEGRLSPTATDAARARFLRWMSFVSAAIYSLFWICDRPLRLSTDPETVQARIEARIAECWAIMDAQIDPGRYLLGEELSVLDLYVAVVSRWDKGRAAFRQAAPKMSAVVEHVDAEPRLASLWAERFPLTS